MSMQQSIIDRGDDLLTDLQQRFAPDDIEALIEALFEATDRNADGRVTFDEFKATVETHPYIYRQMHGPVFWQWVTLPLIGYGVERLLRYCRVVEAKNPDRSGDRAASPDPHGPARLGRHFYDGRRSTYLRQTRCLFL